MEGIKRMNVVVVREQGQGVGIPPRHDPFAMEVDWGRNCYACGILGTWLTIVGTRDKGEE